MSSWSEERKTSKGKPRHRARYRNRRGQIVDIGTFKRKTDADNAAEKAYQDSRAGRLDPNAGKISFRDYVTNRWLPFHVMEISTRQSYVYPINRHLIPWFGDMQMIDIRPQAVREWIAHLQTVDRHYGKRKLKPKTIRNLKYILSAICTSAVIDEVIATNPCLGAKTPTVAKRVIKIVTPEQFDVLYGTLPSGDVQLLVETDIETGLRWSELIDLRPNDFSEDYTLVTVTHCAIEVNPKFHPEGRRFVLKDYPKDAETRRIRISPQLAAGSWQLAAGSWQLAAKIAHHVETNNIGDDDLIFEHYIEPRHIRLEELPDPETLGFTEPNEKGRTYRHGTKSAYTAGACRCQHCRNAMAAYRAQRRTNGKDLPVRKRAPIPGPTELHISRDWFRDQVWKPALKAARLGIHVRVHDLRHAHASWLLAGGANIYVVKERLGHGSITTTEQYLHTLPDAQDEALGAFAAIRNRSKRA